MDGFNTSRLFVNLEQSGSAPMATAFISDSQVTSVRGKPFQRNTSKENTGVFFSLLCHLSPPVTPVFDFSHRPFYFAQLPFNLDIVRCQEVKRKCETATDDNNKSMPLLNLRRTYAGKTKKDK